MIYLGLSNNLQFMGMIISCLLLTVVAADMLLSQDELALDLLDKGDLGVVLEKDEMVSASQLLVVCVLLVLNCLVVYVLFNITVAGNVFVISIKVSSVAVTDCS